MSQNNMYPPLDLEAIREKKNKTVSTKEALEGVTVIDWNINKKRNTDVQSRRHNSNI